MEWILCYISFLIGCVKGEPIALVASSMFAIAGAIAAYKR
jgi:hypothetical protein